MADVVFRADASEAIGSGHVMRCLALAEVLRASGARTSFLSRALPGDLHAVIRAHGHPLTVLANGDVDESTDAQQSLTGLAAAPDWLVVDHYRLGAVWERTLRSRVGRILAIDDLADRAHDCDVLLDQNLIDAPADRYARLLPTTCRCLLGPRFALLRPEFARRRALSPMRDGHGRRILVFFGGADAGNATAQVLAAIESLGACGLSVCVVVGSANRNRQQIERQCRRLGAEFHCQTEGMAELMANSDLAIGAGGIAVWERCCLGLPALAWAVAENQKPGLASLARRGAVVSPAPDSLSSVAGVARHLYSFLHNPELRRFTAERGLELCDGLGAQRVFALMRGDEIRLRPALADDCAAVYAWRNDPAVRRFSTDPSPIGVDQHNEWYKRTLERNDRALLIAEDRSGRPLGVLRYDFADAKARVSIYLVPAAIGKGLGEMVLRKGEEWLAENRHEVTQLTACIRLDNGASRAIFGRVGFHEDVGLFSKSMKP